MDKKKYAPEMVATFELVDDDCSDELILVDGGIVVDFWSSAPANATNLTDYKLDKMKYWFIDRFWIVQHCEVQNNVSTCTK